jgi:glycosyltransferase involved in cell wall biosynthesis
MDLRALKGHQNQELYVNISKNIDLLVFGLSACKLAVLSTNALTSSWPGNRESGFVTASKKIDDILAATYRHVPSLNYGLPQALVGVWLSSGADFQLAYDIESDDGADDLVFWWLSQGRREYRGIRNMLDRYLVTKLHIDLLPEISGSSQAAVTSLLSLFYLNRKDLRDQFDLTNAHGVSSLWIWWLRDGQREILEDADWLLQAQVKYLHHCEIDDPIRVPSLTPIVQIFCEYSNPTLVVTHDSRAMWKYFLAAQADAIDLPDRGLPQVDCLRAFKLPSGQNLPSELMFIYALRSDLHTIFDMDEVSGRSAFLMWWLQVGFLDFGDLGKHIHSSAMQNLHWNHLEAIIAAGSLSLTPLLSALLEAYSDLNAAFDVKTSAGLSAFWQWWMQSGSRNYLNIQADLAETLRHVSAIDLAEVAPNRHRLPSGKFLPNELVFVRAMRPDLQQLFDTRTEEGTSALATWWIESGAKEYPGLVLRLNEVPEVGFDDSSTARAHSPAEISSGRVALCPAESQVASQGHQSQQAVGSGLSASNPVSRVYLAGYPRGEFGLGEDIRLLRQALESSGIAPTVVRANWPISARQEADEICIDIDQAEFDGDVIFYVMPAFDTVTLLNKAGPRAFSATRKIGFWQWELERFPRSARLAIDLVDEIWCHSAHSEKAFRNATDKPVVRVPLPVFVPEPKRVSRAVFGLPENGFVVFTSFDGASSIARKNPLAAIVAFQQAFGDSAIDARLIVKAMNTNKDSLWRECLRKAAADSRIVILDYVMDRNVYYELLRNCDAVLSLHRAEGFGRLMAEAMALGIPVIASRYSGNLDFMTDENSWLIDGDLIPLLPGDYAFYQNQKWLEPRIAEAARALWECATNATARSQRAAAARHDIVAKYSPEVCGKIYVKLLDMDHSRKKIVKA